MSISLILMSIFPAKDSLLAYGSRFIPATFYFDRKNFQEMLRSMCNTPFIHAWWGKEGWWQRKSIECAGPLHHAYNIKETATESDCKCVCEKASISGPMWWTEQALSLDTILLGLNEASTWTKNCSSLTNANNWFLIYTPEHMYSCNGMQSTFLRHRWLGMAGQPALLMDCNCCVVVSPMSHAGQSSIWHCHAFRWIGRRIWQKLKIGRLTLLPILIFNCAFPC